MDISQTSIRRVDALMSKINIKNLLEKILEHLTDEFYVFVENEIQEVILEVVNDLDYWLGIIERDREAKSPQYDNEYILGDLKSKWRKKL